MISFHQVEGANLRAAAPGFASAPVETWRKSIHGFSGTGFEHDTYQSINLVRECGSERLFLVGTSRSGPVRRIDPGSPVAHL